MMMTKKTMKELYSHVEKFGVMLEATENRIGFMIHNYVATLTIAKDMMYISIVHKLAKPPEDLQLLNMLNQSVPFGNFTIDDSGKVGEKLYIYRSFLPFMLEEQDIVNPVDDSKLDNIRDHILRAEIAACGGYYLLQQSYFAKNVHHEFQQFREWINCPDKFPHHLLEI